MFLSIKCPIVSLQERDFEFMDTDEPGLDTLMDDEDYQAQQPGSGFGPNPGAGGDTGGSGDIEDPGPGGDQSTTPGKLGIMKFIINF